jgi:transcriptional regulator with XRE-family HTH domain
VRGRLEKVLARRLREVAAQKGIALSHVADRAGVARSYFWRLLDGSSSATLAAVQRIAEALDVEPLALLGSSGQALAAPVSDPSRRLRPEGVPSASRALGSSPRRRGALPA